MKIHKYVKSYIGILIVGIVLIAVYKTFDSFDVISSYVRTVISLLTPLTIGSVIAYILYLPCRKIEQLLMKAKHRFIRVKRRGIAVAAIYVVFIILLVLLFGTVIPAIYRSIMDFIEQFPTIVGDLYNWLTSLEIYQIQEDNIKNFILENVLSISELISNFDFSNVGRYAQGVISFGNGIFQIFIGIIISVYILLDRSNILNFIKRASRLILKEKHYTLIAKYLHRINEFVNKYIYCMLIDAVVIFILSFIAMSIIGVSYAPLFALIVGLFNLIPYFGAIVATVVTGVITVFTGSFTQAIITVITLIVIQQLDANLIQPRLFADSLQVKPLYVILGITVGGGLFGMAGIFFAVPIIALIRSIILELMERRETLIAMDGIGKRPDGAADSDSGSGRSANNTEN